jgi:tRNA U34 2-thiouridine synthase MnmA/TrmU
MEGVLIEAETGDYLGIHRGFWFYTIGQRQGLRLPGGPWYALSITLLASFMVVPFIKVN